MRVDCYNASECDISSVEYGDTCYYSGKLWIRANVSEVPITSNKCAIVALDTGDMKVVDSNTQVVLADTKVVANTKDTF